MKALQALAVTDELRFEVSKQTALAFVVKRKPDDVQQLAEAISQRHGVVSKQQAHRLDVAYCSFAAAAAACSVAARTLVLLLAFKGRAPSPADLDRCIRAYWAAQYNTWFLT